jgi:LEA14-like dessication related protein
MSTPFIFSCETLRQFIKKPTVSYESMEIRNMSLFEGTIAFNFIVKNPNPIGMSLDKLSYNLKIDGKEFVKGVLDKGVNLKAGGSDRVEIPITVNYLDLAGSLSSFLKKDSLSYDLSGAFEIMGFGIPFNTQGNLAVPKLPKISLNSINVKELSFIGATLIFSLNINNQNPFAVDIKGFDYSIKLNDTKFTEGRAKTSTNISKSGKSTVKIPAKINFIELGRASYGIFRKSSSGYQVTGNIKLNVPKVGEKSFPFSSSGNVPFIK